MEIAEGQMTGSIRGWRWSMGAAAVLALGLAACGDNTGGQTTEAADASHDGMDMAGEPGPLPDGRYPAPDGARVYFANLSDGDVVTSPFTVEFGADGISVVEAGDQTGGTGHHHLLVNTTLDDLDLEFPIPNDEQNLHFGMAQTETTLILEPGEYTLQLVMGDWTHISHVPPVASDVITITVE